MKNEQNILPQKVKCEYCAVGLELDMDERIEKKFICPKCNKENDYSSLSTEQNPNDIVNNLSSEKLKMFAKQPVIYFLKVIVYVIELIAGFFMLRFIMAYGGMNAESAYSNLFYALCIGGIGIFILYLSNKLTVNPLMKAAEAGKLESVKYYFSQGFKVDEKDGSKRTALFYAVSNGNKEIVDFLLDKGADINKVDKDYKSVLYVALEKKQFDLFPYLISKGAKIDAGVKLWDCAIDSKKPDIIEVLLNMGVNVNDTFVYLEYKPGGGADIHYKVTPLIAAIINNDINMVKLLIEKGANPNIKDRDEKSALEYAEGKTEIARLLKNAGAIAKDRKLP